MLLDRTATTKNIGAIELLGDKTEVVAGETRNNMLQYIQAQVKEVPVELQSYLFKYQVKIAR